MTPLRAHPEGTLVEVWAVPGARRTHLAGLHGDALRIRVTAPPEAGKANQAVAELLAGITGAGRVELQHGHVSRRKVFLLVGVSMEKVTQAVTQEITEARTRPGKRRKPRSRPNP